MDYNEEWDEEVKDPNALIKECKDYANERMQKYNHDFEEMLEK